MALRDGSLRWFEPGQVLWVFSQPCWTPQVTETGWSRERFVSRAFEGYHLVNMSGYAYRIWQSQCLTEHQGRKIMLEATIDSLLSPADFDALIHQEVGKLWWKDHASIITYIQGEPTAN